MTEDLGRQLSMLAEKQARERKKAKDERIQRAILSKINKNVGKIKKLELAVANYTTKERKAISEKKTVWAVIWGWFRKRKERKLSELKAITPSVRSQ